ncbi:MAG: helix-turn-helix domain-containing protein [Ktedonobacteraceae bacterium]
MGKKRGSHAIVIKLKVKEAAKVRGISMGKLSRMSDVDRNTIKRMFDDPNYHPTVDTLHKVAKALKVTLNDLVEEIPDPENDK